MKGRLTDEEFENIKQHPVLGKEILSSIKQSPYLSLGAHYHHERYDGTGYPNGLAGNDIPLCARIMSVADVLDALLSRRPYKREMTLTDAMKILSDGKGTQFDPVFADIILKMIDEDTEYKMKEQLR